MTEQITITDLARALAEEFHADHDEVLSIVTSSAVGLGIEGGPTVVLDAMDVARLRQATAGGLLLNGADKGPDEAVVEEAGGWQYFVE